MGEQIDAVDMKAVELTIEEQKDAIYMDIVEVTLINKYIEQRHGNFIGDIDTQIDGIETYIEE